KTSHTIRTSNRVGDRIMTDGGDRAPQGFPTGTLRPCAPSQFVTYKVGQNRRTILVRVREPLRFGEDNPTANLFADVSNILAPDLGSRVPAAAPCKVDSRRSGTLRLLPVPSHGSILISCLAPILCESIHGSAVPSRRYLRSTSSGGFLASA
ncbi:hypothetical protein T310_8620, partial [Rasamsonia emersonii CBS 393.64]